MFNIIKMVFFGRKETHKKIKIEVAKKILRPTLMYNSTLSEMQHLRENAIKI